MPRSPPKTAPHPADPAPAADGATASKSAPTTVPPGQPSRVKTVWVGGHFDPTVAFALKALALEQGTTVQALIGRALNDLLEKHRRGRPASETVLPRGGAAHRRPPSTE